MSNFFWTYETHRQGAIIKKDNMTISYVQNQTNKCTLLSPTFKIEENKVPLFVLLFGLGAKIWTLCHPRVATSQRATIENDNRAIS